MSLRGGEEGWEGGKSTEREEEEEWRPWVCVSLATRQWIW